MSKTQWDKVTARYFTREQLDAFDATVAALPPGFNQDDYAAKWKQLGDRIQAALPMDPASPKAQAFLDEWQALIQPFLDNAPPQMVKGMMNFYNHIEEWEGDVTASFGSEVYRFHQEAARAREAMKK